MNVNVNVNVGVRVTVSARVSVSVNAGLWDQQRRARSECECECGCACYCACACECECECVSGIFQMRWVARRFTPVCRSRCGARGADRNPGAGTADLAKLAKLLFSCSAPPRGPGGPGIARARRDLPNEHSSRQIHAGLSKSMWHPRAERGPGAGRFVRVLGSLPLCVLLLVQADRKDTSHRALGSAAESTL